MYESFLENVSLLECLEVFSLAAEKRKYKVHLLEI